MWSIIGSTAIKAAMSMIVSLASEEFFKDIFMWLAKKAVESSKTKWDDELYRKIEKALEEK